MGMRITFELTDRDLGFFRKALRQSRAAVKDAEDAEIIDAIHAVLDEIRSSEPLPVGTRVNLEFTVLIDSFETVSGEGEVVRKADMRVETGGKGSRCFEFLRMAELDDITDGQIRVVVTEAIA